MTCTDLHLAVVLSIYKNDELNFVISSIVSLLRQTYLVFDLYLMYDGEIPVSYTHLTLPTIA